MSSSRAGGVDSTRLFCVVFAPVVVVVVVVVDVGGRVSATSGGDLTGVCLALFGRGQCRGWFGLLRQEYPSCDCLKVFYILGQQAANVLANIGCLQSCGHRLTTRSTSGINSVVKSSPKHGSDWKQQRVLPSRNPDGSDKRIQGKGQPVFHIHRFVP